MLTDLTPKKDGVIAHNMEDDVIRGATAAHMGAVTFPPPPPKIAAIAVQKPKEKAKELTPGRTPGAGSCGLQGADPQPGGLLAIGGGLMLLAGLYAPASFMSHFIVFVLAVFVGFQVIWNVSHSACTRR
jgi:NAD(P) transhydrogenase subunit alpha